MSTDAGIYFQGWMHKKNDNKFMGEKWNKRWFVLYEDGILAYYANQVLEDKKNSVNLRGSKLKVLPKEHVNKRRPYCFELETKERTFLLSCQNEKEWRSWMYWLSKGHPEAPRERSCSFFNLIIEDVLKEAEGMNKKMSLTRRVTEAAETSKVSYRGRERVYSADSRKKCDQIDIHIFDSKRPANSPDHKPEETVPHIESVRVSRPWIDIECKDNDTISPPPPESEFAHKLQDFVKENEKTMEKVIDNLVRAVDEKENENYATI